MNNNYYQNQYGYNTYPYNQQQFQQINNGFNQQQMNQNLSNYNNYQNQYAQGQAQQQIRVKCEFIAVSSFEEVKSFLMNPNTTVLFKDVNNKILYEKKTDSQGISEIKAYQEMSLQENKNNKIEYLTLNDFQAFKTEIEEKINKLSGGNNE